MFDDFYDQVVYKRFSKTDHFGNLIYEDEVYMQARFCKGTQVYTATEGGTKTVYQVQYHVKPEINIREKDLIDSYVVKKVMPIRDVSGLLCYWKVWCE